MLCYNKYARAGACKWLVYRDNPSDATEKNYNLGYATVSDTSGPHMSLRHQ
jgi:hypothetical protein